MATIKKKYVLTEGGFGGATPYGNALAMRYSFETNAAGVFVNSDTAAAVGNGDKVIIGVLPAGIRLDDALGIVSDAFTALSTGKIGFEYVDGVDDADVPQDDDYFFAALSLAAAGRTRANNTGVRPVLLPKDAYLTLVNGGAAQAAAGAFDLIVYGATGA
jgi:hypothetical protein